jgi:hypothetical protein
VKMAQTPMMLSAVIGSRARSPTIRSSMAACRGTMFALRKLNCILLYHYSHYGLFIPLHTGSYFRWALLERSGSREGSRIHRCQLVRETSGTVVPLAGAHVCHGDGEAT